MFRVAPIDQNFPSGSLLPAQPVEANGSTRAPEGPARRDRVRGVTFFPIPAAGPMDEGGDGPLPHQ